MILPNEYQYARLEIIERLEVIKESIKDMTKVVRESLLSEDIHDEELVQLSEKIKVLEKQIVNVIQN